MFVFSHIFLKSLLYRSQTLLSKLHYCNRQYMCSSKLCIKISKWSLLEQSTAIPQPSDMSSLPDGRSTAGPIRMSLYIFLIYNIYYLCCLCIDFYDLSAWYGCWFVAYIRKFICTFLNVCPLHNRAVAGSGKVGP